MAIGNINITTELVKNTLGEATHNVGKLCTSPSINKWSFFKPVEYYTGGNGIEEEHLYACNDGFNLSNVESHSCTDVLNKYYNNEVWQYEAPTTTFRLGDFRQYDHYAQPFINFNERTGIDLNNVPLSRTLQFDFQGTRNLQWLINFNAYPATSSLELGMLIYTNATAGTMYYYKFLDMLDYDEHTHFECSLIGQGTYYMMPVFRFITSTPMNTLTTVSDKDNIYTYYSLPVEPLRITINGTTPIPTSDIEIDLNNIDYNVQLYTVSVYLLTVDMYNNSISDIDVSYTLTFQDDVNHSVSYTGNTTLHAGSNTVVIYDGGKDSTPLRYESLNGEPVLNIQYTYNGNTYNWTHNIK